LQPFIFFQLYSLQRYFDVYFPAAIKTAQQLRQRGGKERLIYTTHPWLVSLYVDCQDSLVPTLPGMKHFLANNETTQAINVSLHCPSAAALATFEAAVQRGDIAWHAYPFVS
jgi:hypothetical protein